MSVEIRCQRAARAYLLPATVQEALALASLYRGEYQFYAGGTDAQALRQIGLPGKPVIIDLSRISELSELRVEGDTLHIGALVKLDKLITSPVVKSLYPLIAEAAASVATPVICKTATLGGNMLVSNRCSYYNQSLRWRTAAGSCLRDTGDTCLVTGVRDGKCFSRNVSDTAPALIALGADVTIRNRNKEHSVPVHDLYAQDGLKSLRHMDEGGIITGLRVSSQVKAWGYRKLRLRRSVDFTSLTIAVCLDMSGVVRICLNGVSMAPVLITGRLSDLSLDGIIGQTRSKAKLVDNDLMPFEYRKDMMAVYLEELWNILRAA